MLEPVMQNQEAAVLSTLVLARLRLGVVARSTSVLVLATVELVGKWFSLLVFRRHPQGGALSW